MSKLRLNTILFFLLATAITIGLYVSDSYSHKLNNLAKEKERIEDNLYNYGRSIASLTLTNDEMKNELQKGNEKLIRADSILKSKNSTIKQLQHLLSIDITIIEKDTVFLPADTVFRISEGQYKIPFTDYRGCIRIDGFILSSDSVPSVAITKREAEIKVYDMKIKRKWWQFWKQKQQRIIDTNCGEIKLLEVNKIN